AVLHFSGEQPLLCDLRELPAPGSAYLVCTNLRFVDGRRPGFIDRTDSWFVFPLALLRFVEMPPTSLDGGADASPGTPAVPAARPVVADDGGADELLRRVREI
ncbi:MAG: hypothetical protein ACKOTZ_00420, partial [Chloroflexota bacterium]